MSASIAFAIRNRRDFVDYFESALLHAHASLLAERLQAYESNLPKSYLVEFHPIGGVAPSADILEKRLREVGESAGVVADRIGDDLFQLSHQRDTWIIDAANPRFTIFHTLAKSTAADRFVFSQFVPKSPTFDRAWLSPDFLETFADDVTVEGWGARFSPLVDPAKLDDPAFSTQKVRVDLDARDSWARYKRFKNSGDFQHLPLDVIRVRSRSEDALGRARITSRGKLTARGNSFVHYQRIATDVRDAYAAQIGGLEDRYRLEFPEHQKRVSMQGQPFWIEFKKPLKELGALMARMFSGAEPFRLLGFPDSVRSNEYRVHAVDLHVASRMYVEATPRWFRIFLPEYGCGNSLVRIVRALQYRVTDKLSLPAAL
jgi:hypothetical protein